MMIKKLALTCIIILITMGPWAQVGKTIEQAMARFNDDEQLKYATSSLYIIDVATGASVFDQNSHVGMAPASTQKVITAATAFEILGSSFRYLTKFGIISTPNGKSLYIEPSGDPSLGSWRWEETKELAILDKLKLALKNKAITKLESIIIKTADLTETIPEGWIWQDIGNYYGAASQQLNWRENQFDLSLKSGPAVGDPVSIVKISPPLYDYRIISKAAAGERGSGDNSLLFYPSQGGQDGLLTGTIPAGQSNFIVSGSMIDPLNQFAKTVKSYLKGSVSFSDKNWSAVTKTPTYIDWFFTNTSPALPALVYWFLRKSINLYGEAFLKTIAVQKTGAATTDNGINMIQNYWKDRGVDPEELHLYDGSGLSPQNRVTTHAQVAVLKYARQQPWFKEYYDAFPVYNDIKMKSGTINRVKGFTGYQKSIEGREYIFSFLVNNYSGSEYGLIRKMYRVLDNLK